MVESSLRLLITKLIPFLTFLLLTLFCSAFKSQTKAKATTLYTRGVLPKIRGGVSPKVGGAVLQSLAEVSPHHRYSSGSYGRENNCSSNKGLPCEEVEALNIVLDKLGLKTKPTIKGSFCNESQPYSGLTIGRNFTTSNVCHISEISKTNSRLNGFIHEYVSMLKYLQSLDLSGNQLQKTIPSSLGKLSMLTTLNLGGNQLSGSIPESLGNLKFLTKLNLNANLLTGRIPPSLGNLMSLQHLDLSINKLEGEIPKELGKLSKLTLLYLDDIKLSGPLPPELGNLRKLERLSLTSNNFTGKLPDYSNLTNLEEFQISGNNLSGPIPPSIQNWVNLTYLDLMGNNFEGELPPGIFKMSKLWYLSASDVKNQGFSFPTVANLTEINVLILKNCSITGKIPPYMGNWHQLLYLDLSFNKLRGGIPDSLNNTDLSYMYFTGNMLNGKVPAWINNKVIKADLSYNNFIGATLRPEVDGAYNNSTNVTSEAATRVNISPYSASKSNWSAEYCKDGKSKYDSLFINSGGKEVDIRGTLYEADNLASPFYASPKGNWAYTCAEDFWIENHNSSDYIKSTTCGVSDIDELLYERSRFCPTSLTYYGFCLHEGRYNVTLHFAEIVYAVDQDYSSLGKRVFDVYIQGGRVLKDFNIQEKAGGPKKATVENFPIHVGKNDNNLLTINFFWAGKGSKYNLPGLNGPLVSAISVTRINVNHRKLSAWQIVGIIVGSIVALLLLLALLWRMGLLGNKEMYEKKIEIRGKYYSLKQLMDATRKFSPKMEIGKGHFGAVYKAELPDQTVAVRKLSYLSKQVIDQIETEVYALKSFKHENLVELLATYSRKGLHLVIYEYMENKSLKEALFDSRSSGVLPWDVRYNICLEIAEGLKYLHERIPRVIHRNIKACIVLLDGNFKAKISDFGLAKLYEEENPYMVIRAEGTLVYMAPEYATRRAISDKIDVYSFGVLLLEIVSGRDNAKYNENQETVFLLDEACVSHTKGKLLDLVDRNLSSTYNRGQAINVLNLAMMCIDQSPTLRPTMSEVVDVLEGNKTIEQISKVATLSE